MTISKVIFLTNFTSNLILLLVKYNLPFHEFLLIECRPLTTLLNHEQLFDVNQNLLAEALKNKFSV